MTEQLPEPLVPAEVDLNGYGFMPMLHHRVLQSTLFVKSTGDEFKAAFALWCASWSEKPAGSLPNDDQMLEHFSRSKVWRKVRDRALHGWVLCSDGRLYHRTLAPLAIDAWARREEFREVQENRETRQDRWRRRVKELSEQLRAIGVTPPRNAGLDKLETLLRDAQASTRETRRDGSGDAAETSHARRAEMALTGTGRTETSHSVADATDAGASPDTADVIFGLGVPLLTAAGVSDRNARSMLGMLRKQHGDAGVIDALQRCATEKPLQPVPWLQAALKAKAPSSARPARTSATDRQIATMDALTGRSRNDGPTPLADVIDVTARAVG